LGKKIIGGKINLDSIELYVSFVLWDSEKEVLYNSMRIWIEE
jgi:hypothetical protein